ETGADTPRCTHGSAARDRAAGPARPPLGRTTAPPTPKTSFPAGLPRSSPPLRYLPDIAGRRVVHSLAKHRSIPWDVLSVPAGTNAIISASIDPIPGGPTGQGRGDGVRVWYRRCVLSAGVRRPRPGTRRRAGAARVPTSMRRRRF